MKMVSRANFWICSSVALFAIAVLVDRFAFGRPAFMESIPVLSPGQWMLSLLLLLSAAALLLGVVPLRSRNGAAMETFAPWSHNDRWASILGLSVHVACVVLLLVSPYWFNNLILEDRPVENASALFWFVAFALTLIACLRTRRQLGAVSIQFSLLMIVLSALFFVCGMEEVSWFQRVLHVSTPDAIARMNMQGELNLHNLATHPTENIFYNGMVVLLVLVPGLNSLRVIRLEQWNLGAAVPRPYLVVVGVLATAWNFNKWDIPLFQFALYLSVLMTIVLAMRSGSPKDRAILLATVAATIIGQAIFLIFGDHFLRDWDVTEYRELLMPLGAMMYACNVFAATRSTAESVVKNCRPSGRSAAALSAKVQ
jgi:hypothetical protein